MEIYIQNQWKLYSYHATRAIRELVFQTEASVIQVTVQISQCFLTAAARAFDTEIFNSGTLCNYRGYLNEHSKRYNIYVIWVPVYCNISGNYRPNELARFGSTIRLFNDFAIVGVLLEACGHMIDTTIMDSDNAWWSASARARTASIIWLRLLAKRTVNLS